MPSFLLVCAAVSILLLGCRIEEKQEQAADFVESAAENIVEGIGTARRVQEQVAGHLSGAAQKVGATAGEMQERAAQLEQGVKKVTGAVGTLKDGVQDVGGALTVSGESSGEE